jgi:hypothetical protein
LRKVQRLLGLERDAGPLHLISDDHPAYGTVLARPNVAQRVRHAIARCSPEDQLHGLIRHTLAAHHREAIAFGRRLNTLMERMCVFLAWRNFIKGRSERKPDPDTPAMRLGLTHRPWSWEMVLAHRAFPVREGLRGVCGELDRREWTTPVLPRNRRHELKFAY